MESVLIYFLKCAGLLSLFFIAYILFLRNDTSFGNNRRFLLAGIFSSFILPSLEFTRTVVIEESPFPTAFLTTTSVEIPVLDEASAAIDWWHLAGMAYWAVVGILFFRFFWQLLFLLRFLSKGKKVKDSSKFTFIHSEEEISPFSFFRYIVFNPSLHSPKELEIILQHERVHARQWHSVDALASHLATTFLWFNPLTWWYRNNLEQNLEYIADRETVATAVSLQQYQKTLVSISVKNYQPPLTNQFYRSFIKKRIIMLNDQTRSGNNLWKTSLVLPFLLAFMFFFQFKTEAQILTNPRTSGEQAQSDLEISSTITKNSQNETLENLKRIFRKKNVELNFDNIQRSPEGMLTAITASFINSNTGESGTVSRNNSAGIEPFTIYSKKNGTGIIETSSPPPAGSGRESLLGKIEIDPLYIIGNKEYQASDLYGKSVHVKGEVKALTPLEGIKKYGDKAKGGVLIIPEGELLDDFGSEMKKIDSQREAVVRNYIRVRENGKPDLISVNKEPDPVLREHKSNRSDTTGFSQNWQRSKMYSLDTNASQSKNTLFIYRLEGRDKKPLYIVDGKEMNRDFSINSVNPENIRNITVLTGDTATGKYGKKAKDGAIEISMKTEDEKAKTPIQKKKDDKGSSSEKNSIMIPSGDKKDFVPAGQLFVIDGREMAQDFDPSMIDHNDIESIAVLKGENATNKYGEKASGGVLEITTSNKKYNQGTTDIPE